MNNLVLGAGLAGLSASYHLGHESCLVLEKDARPFGLAASEVINGITWDHGPHVSFTRHDYVRDLFRQSVGDRYNEIDACVRNYFFGRWIDHPAQSNLHQVPERLRTRCLESFLATRTGTGTTKPATYWEWLVQAFGPVFAEAFPRRYTRKYWTRQPEELTVDWVGERVFYPSVDDVVKGARGPLDRNTHYVSRVRYPQRGGFESFGVGLAAEARIHLDSEVVRVNLRGKQVLTRDGRRFDFARLISTLPLPAFVRLCDDVPAPVLEACAALSCSSLLTVNVACNLRSAVPGHWIYVYDDERPSTRLCVAERFSPANAPEGWTGVQAEVYARCVRDLEGREEDLARDVVADLRDMELLPPADGGHVLKVAWRLLPYANIIFDRDRVPALDTILRWLEAFGLVREPDDLHPTTEWNTRLAEAADGQAKPGSLVLAGRFGQWKYFWSDDCVLRGRFLGQMLGQQGGRRGLCVGRASSAAVVVA